MLPDRFRRLVEDLVPWYDRAAEARRAEQSQRLARRSVSALEHAERVLAEPSGNDRIRRAYQQYADGMKR